MFPSPKIKWYWPLFRWSTVGYETHLQHKFIMDPFNFMKKLYISTYAVEVCKQLHQIDIDQCCGCKQTEGKECLMLTEDEKIEINFDRILKVVDVKSVVERVMNNMKPFHLSARTKTELYAWLPSSNPSLEIYQKINI